MKSINKILIISIIVVFLVICFFIFTKYLKDEPGAPVNQPGSGGNTVQPPSGNNPPTNNPPANPPPSDPYLTEEQMSLLTQTISSSEFVKDLPKEGIIALRFYDFIGDYRIWKNDIFIGRDGILNSGSPDLVLLMHAKYIMQLKDTDLCGVMANAQTNGEMWTESEYSDAKLLFKYSGMLKYRDCLGF
jgi:hypothetical protein